MWKKAEPDHPERADATATAHTPVTTRELCATIGASITIRGDLGGEEDLLIQGRVEGKIDLKQHKVTIGKDGHIKADIYAKTVVIEGEVNGNMFSDEQLIIRKSGRVRGNIVSPRVTLEDGAKLKGSIDMDQKPAEHQRSPNEIPGQTKPAVSSIDQVKGLGIRS